MKIDRKNLYMNILFLAFILPPIFIVSYTYQNYYKKIETSSIANPYGLYIDKYNISSSSIYLSIYNPNNYTVFIYFPDLRISNSLGDSAIISNRISDNIVTIYPKSNYNFYYTSLFSNQQYIGVVAPYLKLGGYLIVALDYSAINSSISGTIVLTIQSNKTQ